jgi:AcrR family transcriptional regulator
MTGHDVDALTLAETGLRGRKKQQTRAAIAKTATELFAERGFEAVTVDQIARSAGVARQTVFNHFATKEEMLFDRDHEVLTALVTAVSARGSSAAPVDVFRAHTAAFWERVKSCPAGEPSPADVWSVVQSSPALRNHLEVVFARHARAVGHELARERGLPEDDASSHAVARALCSVNSAILTCGLDRIARGEDPAAVADQMLSDADGVYNLLERGLIGRDAAGARVAGPVASPE